METHVSQIHGPVKLGWKPPSQAQLRLPRLHLSDYIDTSLLPPLPAIVDYFSKVKNWGMMLNDQQGDCTCAGIGHGIQVWTANAATQYTPPDADVEKLYIAMGYDPKDPEDTDNGAQEIDVLRYVKAKGFSGYTIDAFVSVDPKNYQHVMYCIYLFGFAYNGLLLPRTCLNQTVWDVVDPSLTGDSAPGSLGGHCTINPGYATGLGGHFPTVTWGTVLQMTRAFWDAYTFMCWGLLSKAWMERNGNTPAGFAYQDMLSDMAKIRN